MLYMHVFIARLDILLWSIIDHCRQPTDLYAADFGREEYFFKHQQEKRKRHIFVYDEQPYSYFREKDSSSHLFSEWQQGVEMKEERSFSLKAGNKSYMRVKFFISLRFISIYFWILSETLENIISYFLLLFIHWYFNV